MNLYFFSFSEIQKNLPLNSKKKHFFCFFRSSPGARPRALSFQFQSLSLFCRKLLLDSIAPNAVRTAPNSPSKKNVSTIEYIISRRRTFNRCRCRSRWLHLCGRRGAQRLAPGGIASLEQTQRHEISQGRAGTRDHAGRRRQGRGFGFGFGRRR